MAKSDVRYGSELRKRAKAVELARRASYECPKCSKESVKRTSNAIWECRSCGAKFAGGTYSLSTPSGDVALRMIKDFKKEKAAQPARKA